MMTDEVGPLGEDDDDDDDDDPSDEVSIESSGSSSSSRTAKDEVAASTARRRSEFVAKASLCLRCRRPASTLCRECEGAYFCCDASPSNRDCRKEGCVAAELIMNENRECVQNNPTDLLTQFSPSFFLFHPILGMLYALAAGPMPVSVARGRFTLIGGATCRTSIA